MASFNGNIGTPSGGFNLKVEYSISQSVSGNYSDVTATGYVKRNNSSYYPYNSSSSASLSINGTSKGYSGSYDLRSDGYKTIVSNTVRVYHNSDGTKSITISFSFNGLLSSYYPNGSISQTITLPTIPRASDVACSSPYIGDTATITISKKASGFTSTVSYKIGTLSGTLATKTSDTVLSLPTSDLVDSIYAQIPSSKSIQGTITCQTYNGSTLIGTKTCNFNLYAKEEECKPTISGTVIDTNEKTIAITGDNTKLIKYVSKPKVTIEATANKSATISSYSINLNDGQTSSSQEETFNSIGSDSITINVIDSRGYSSQQTITPEMIDYIKLDFVIPDNGLSRPEDTSNEVLLNASGMWFNDSFNEENINTLSVNFEYKKSGDSEWTDGGKIEPTIDGNAFKFNDFSLGNIYDYNEEYQFRITVTDLLITIIDSSVCHKGIALVEYVDGLVNVNGRLTVNDKDVLTKIGQMIRVYNTTEQTINPNTLTKLNFNKIKDNTSDSLTFEDNKIIIGKGVRTVLVNGRWTKSGTYAKYIYVFQNGKSYSFNMSTASTIETSVVLPVEEGDYIELFSYHENSSAISVNNDKNQTFLQVTVLN